MASISVALTDEEEYDEDAPAVTRLLAAMASRMTEYFLAMGSSRRNSSYIVSAMDSTTRVSVSVSACVQISMSNEEKMWNKLLDEEYSNVTHEPRVPRWMNT